MANLLIKDIPRYECLLAASRNHPDLDPSACEVFMHLLRAGDEAFSSTEQNLTDHGISPGRFGVLMQLWGYAQMCPGTAGLAPAELADRSNVTRATMTGLIDTLERDGFVKRTADEHDRRMMRVGLTARAHEFMREFLPGHFQRMASLVQPLSPDERKTLVALLDKIHRQASALLPVAGEPQAAAV